MMVQQQHHHHNSNNDSNNDSNNGDEGWGTYEIGRAETMKMGPNDVFCVVWTLGE